MLWFLLINVIIMFIINHNDSIQSFFDARYSISILLFISFTIFHFNITVHICISYKADKNADPLTFRVSLKGRICLCTLNVCALFVYSVRRTAIKSKASFTTNALYAKSIVMVFLQTKSLLKLVLFFFSAVS